MNATKISEEMSDDAVERILKTINSDVIIESLVALRNGSDSKTIIPTTPQSPQALQSPNSPKLRISLTPPQSPEFCKLSKVSIMIDLTDESQDPSRNLFTFAQTCPSSSPKRTIKFDSQILNAPKKPSTRIHKKSSHSHSFEPGCIMRLKTDLRLCQRSLARQRENMEQSIECIRRVREDLHLLTIRQKHTEQFDNDSDLFE
jgi:hypothetical protein